VCSEKEDSVTISDMVLDCELQKHEIETFTEQSLPLSLDKMYPFPQMLVNSLNSAKTAAHLNRDYRQQKATGFSFDIRQHDNSQKHQQCLQSISEEFIDGPRHLQGKPFCSQFAL